MSSVVAGNGCRIVARFAEPEVIQVERLHLGVSQDQEVTPNDVVAGIFLVRGGGLLRNRTVIRQVAPVSVAEPTAVPTTTPATVDTSTLPTAPEPTTSTKTTPRGPKNGRFVWPRNENGWTIVLVSYPKANGRPSALSTADRAASSGLHQVGILDSTRYASLQPGYFVVFTGIYGSRDDADAAVSTARQAGFSGAYSRQIAR